VATSLSGLSRAQRWSGAGPSTRAPGGRVEGHLLQADKPTLRDGPRGDEPLWLVAGATLVGGLGPSTRVPGAASRDTCCRLTSLRYGTALVATSLSGLSRGQRWSGAGTKHASTGVRVDGHLLQADKPTRRRPVAPSCPLFEPEVTSDDFVHHFGRKSFARFSEVRFWDQRLLGGVGFAIARVCGWKSDLGEGSLAAHGGGFSRPATQRADTEVCAPVTCDVVPACVGRWGGPVPPGGRTSV
jgi:hypothetical protein